jgi:hypothetical protein
MAAPVARTTPTRTMSVRIKNHGWEMNIQMKNLRQCRRVIVIDVVNAPEFRFRNAQES